MFKKIKENPYYVKFKEMRADPKLRPITSLVFWFIFMIIVVIFLRSTNTTSSVSQKNVEKISTYEFTYSNNSGIIFGKNYDGNLEFTFGNNRYYYNGEDVYLIKNQSANVILNFDLNVLKITPDFIDSLITNLNYTNSGGAKRYLVPLVNFINLYEFDTEVNLSIASQYNVVIDVYENDDNVYMYKLDLSSYYTLKGKNNEGILTIDIYNNKVNDFTKFYDNLVGGSV